MNLRGTFWRPDCENEDDPNKRRMSPKMQWSALLAEQKISLDSKWTDGRRLGSGSFGSVYEAHSDNGFRFAVKEVSLLDEGSSRARTCVDQLQQEITLLSQLEHKNIVQYYDSYQDKFRLCMFMELVPEGSLQRFYQTYPPSVALLASKYTNDILHGLKYLHDHNVVHRDIKCANILVAQGSAKLADFGVAKIIRKNNIRSFHGSVCWMAPEVVRAQMDNKDYGLPADIWSLGCTVLEMLTKEVPYPDLETQQVVFKISKGKFPEIPDFLPVDAQNFIKKCLQPNPNSRPTAAQLLNHPFVSPQVPRPGNQPRRGSVFKNIVSDLWPAGSQ